MEGYSVHLVVETRYPAADVVATIQIMQRCWLPLFPKSKLLMLIQKIPSEIKPEQLSDKKVK